jgi:NAD(P)H-flavin reductase
VQVHIKLPRPWEFEAGQYLYLCIPALTISLWAWAQSHPYFVSWWFINSEGEQLVVLIVESRRGFSKSLTSHSHKDDSHPKLWRAFIEGPFGHGIRLDDYGTVLLLATSISIASQLPYLKQLLHSYSNHEIKAREVSLFWEVESECEYGSRLASLTKRHDLAHGEWIGEWMTEMLKEDKHKVTFNFRNNFPKERIAKS